MFKDKRNYIPGVIILIITIVLFISNFPSGYLTGWDNLQTGLSPWLAIKRSVFSVWQEYQSFGLISGMAHATDIVRSIFVLALSFLPQHLVRYVEFILFGIIGTIGMFTLLKVYIDDSKRKTYVALIGAMYYLLNFGTIQIFHMPFEPFSYFFASLPWLIYAFHSYVFTYRHKRSSLLLLVLVNFLATPSFYLQTLFVVYVLFLALYGIGGFLKERKTYIIRHGMLAGLMILCVNAFWVLPQYYFLKTGSDVVTHSKINQLATEDVYYQNKEKGTPFNYLAQRGFYYDLEDVNKELLFESWHRHFDTPVVRTIIYAIIALLLLGIIVSSKYRAYFIGPLALTALFMLNNTPIFEELNAFVRKQSLINQIFRSPFTKFIVVQSFVFSYFIAIGSELLLKKAYKVKKLSYGVYASLIIMTLIIYSWPALNGNFFNKTMRTQIPKDYLDTIEYFEGVDKNQRIALMPDYTFWGWYFTDWGYNGSGFLWYGIEQPIVSRTFDVWSPSSESYFWEVKTALEAENSDMLEKVLEKYDIDYILIDHTLRPVSSDISALQYDRLTNLLAEIPRIKQFGFGKDISLYSFNKTITDTSFVSLAKSIPSVGPNSPYIPSDTAYSDFGTYRSSNTTTPDLYYPFRDLFSQTELYTHHWTIQETDEAFELTAQLPGSLSDYILRVPSRKSEIDLFVDGENRSYTVEMDLDIDKESKKLHVTLPKNIIQKIEPTSGSIYPCNKDIGENDVHAAEHFVRIYSNHGSVPCIGYDAPYLDQTYGYLVTVENRNIQGRRLFMSLTDKTKGQAYIEDRLREDVEHYIVAPRFDYGLGYTFTFQNSSYLNIPSTNIIDDISIYQFPYNEIADIRLEKVNVDAQERLNPLSRSIAITTPSHVIKRQYHAYTVDLSHSDLDNDYLILNQVYDDGWHAYVVARDPITQFIPFLVGKKLENHVRINTWAQGWKIPQSCQSNRGDCRVVLVFTPQYLQYVGYLFLLGAIGYGLTVLRRKHH